MKKYEAIHDRYRALVESGTLRAGEKLPSIREEAIASRASINTVSAAYERLADEGWITARDRSGYYVRPKGASRRIGGTAALPDPFLSTGVEAGERLDRAFERLTRKNTGFAVANPGSDLLPLRRMERAFSRLPPSWADYSDPSGEADLKKRIALATESYGGVMRERDIVVTNGATEALAIVFRSILAPGDAVVLESPTYFNYFKQLAPLGVDLIEVPVGKDGIDLDLLEGVFASRRVRAAVVQPNVQNPTGVVMSDAAKARLAGLARAHDVILIQDDVYGDLVFDNERPKNLGAFTDYAGLVTLSSFSKSIAPGLRIGWVHSTSLAERFAEEKLRSSLESGRVAQLALADYVGTSAHRKQLAELRAALERRVDEHLEILGRVLPEGSVVEKPAGGCLLWIAYPSGTEASAVFRRAAERGLIAAPGELFSSNPFFRNYLRLNAGWKLTAERAEAMNLLAPA